jgi:HSP90 family molecular chaperone
MPDEYVKKMGPQQESIYFILANTRDMALNSPYYEPFKKS